METRKHLLLLATAAVVVGCQGTPTIPERARTEEAAEVKLPPLLELPPPAEPVAKPTPLREETPRIAGDERYPFELRGISLANAIHLIAEKARVNMYLDAGLDYAVDASFPAVTLDDALGVLLTQNGLRLVEQPTGVYWVRSDDGSQPQVGTFRVQSIDVASIQDDLQQLVGASAHLVVNEEQNYVMIDGTARDVELVAEYLDGVDRLKRQVLLEVELVELMLDQDFQLGLTHAMNGVDIDGGPNVVSLVQNLGTGNGEFSLTLDNTNVPLHSTLTALSRYVGSTSSPRRACSR
ncbi:MAG: hypothetical protein H6828_00450 [Planctomycetes bacterium]|nr:hypothetical protein [Planctomycetota bacterium]